MRKKIFLLAFAAALLPSAHLFAAQPGEQPGLQQSVQAATAEAEVAAANQKEVENARWEATRARRELEALRKEYEGWKTVNGKTLEISAQNEKLAADVEAMKKEVQSYRLENEKLSTRMNIYWFLAGAAVFAVAFLLGNAFGSTKKRGGSGGYRF